VAITVPVGSDDVKTLTLRRADGTAETEYDESATLVAEAWAGDDRAVAFNPTVAWDEVGEGTITHTIDGDDTADVEPGTYRAMLSITQGAATTRREYGPIVLTAVPGSAVAGKVYCSQNDMLTIFPQLGKLQDIDADQTGFIEQRVEARRWVDRQVMSRARTALDSQARRHAPVLTVDPIEISVGVDAGPDWGLSIYPETTARNQLATIRGHLDDDALMVGLTSAQSAQTWDGGLVRRIAAYYALSLVFEGQVGSMGEEGSETSYQTLARRFRQRAIRELQGWAAGIDTDLDDRPNFEFPA
jgi:hypothetical protein